MRPWLSLCLLLVCVLHCVNASISLQGRLLADLIHLDTTVLLDGGSVASAPVNIDGSFKLDNLPAGEYIFSVNSRVHAFPQLHVTLQADSPPQCRPYKPTFPVSKSAPVLPYPLYLQSSGKLVYDEPKLPFNIIRLITGNPMLLLMGGSVLMMFVMPKLMGSLDPEALAEVQKNQASMQESMSALQSGDFSGGFSKLLAAGAENNNSNNSNNNNNNNNKKPSTSNPSRRR